MSNVRDKLGKAGLFIAGSAFHIALIAFALVLLFWLGKTAYQFGYDTFNEHAMSPGQGKEVTVVIQEGSTPYQIGKTLESKGLIDNAYVFMAQELISNYHGKLQPGTYLLSTAYTPTRIMGILAGDKEQEGTGS